MAVKKLWVSQDAATSNQGATVCLWDEEPTMVGNTGYWDTTKPASVEGHCLIAAFDWEEQDALAEFFGLKPGKCKGFRIQPITAKESE